MTIDQAVILASIIQGEAADTDNMNKVSRVLQNRLENPGTYPRLECDSTSSYAKNMVPGEMAARYSSRRMIPMSGKGFRSAPSTIRAWTPSGRSWSLPKTRKSNSAISLRRRISTRSRVLLLENLCPA